MTFLALARICAVVSALAVLGSLILLFTPSPRLSIEFTGGTSVELALPEGKTRENLGSALQDFAFEGQPLTTTNLATTKTGTLFLRTETLSNEKHQALLAHLQSALPGLTELQYTTIGPTVGASLKRRAIWALFAAVVAIVLYVAAAFRKIPRSLSPWSFGFAAIIALVHDVAITLGVFTMLSHITTFQLDTLFVSAVLSIMGYSVSDTIVIFDRIRDNLLHGGGMREDFSVVARDSLLQCVSRTLNTGLGALIMLASLFVLGSESIRWFILALIVGTVVGTYSSFFVATPLLIAWQRIRKR